MIKWKSLFKPAIRRRGRDILMEESILTFNNNKDILSATVQGIEDYKVKIDINNLDKMTCTCPYFKDGNLCKHQAAVLYAYDEGIRSIAELEQFYQEERREFEEITLPTNDIYEMLKEYDEDYIRNFLASLLEEDENLLKRFRIKEDMNDYSDHKALYNYTEKILYDFNQNQDYRLLHNQLVRVFKLGIFPLLQEGYVTFVLDITYLIYDRISREEDEKFVPIYNYIAIAWKKMFEFQLSKTKQKELLERFLSDYSAAVGEDILMFQDVLGYGFRRKEERGKIRYAIGSKLMLFKEGEISKQRRDYIIGFLIDILEKEYGDILSIDIIGKGVTEISMLKTDIFNYYMNLHQYDNALNLIKKIESIDAYDYMDYEIEEMYMAYYEQTKNNKPK